jgi:hypothetical protein
MSELGGGSGLPGGQVDESEIVLVGVITRIDPGEFELPFFPPIFTNRDLLWREEEPAVQLPDSLSFIYGMEGKAWKSPFSAG